MDMNEIHDYARRLLEAPGDKAELEAAQKAADWKRSGDKYFTELISFCSRLETWHVQEG
jgi:hypothetical protein